MVIPIALQRLWSHVFRATVVAEDLLGVFVNCRIVIDYQDPTVLVAVDGSRERRTVRCCFSSWSGFCADSLGRVSENLAPCPGPSL